MNDYTIKTEARFITLLLSLLGMAARDLKILLVSEQPSRSVGGPDKVHRFLLRRDHGRLVLRGRAPCVLFISYSYVVCLGNKPHIDFWPKGLRFRLVLCADVSSAWWHCHLPLHLFPLLWLQVGGLRNERERCLSRFSLPGALSLLAHEDGSELGNRKLSLTRVCSGSHSRGEG